MSLRQELLAELAEARRELLSAVEGLSEAQMTAPLPGGEWSAKDILAHVASWEELRPVEVARTAGGDQPVYGRLQDDDFDRWNALMMVYRRDLPLEQVLRELLKARERLLAVVAELPDEQLPAAAEGRMRIRRAAHHEREHATQIREWRQREGL